jgi:hypothetical protein
LSEGQTADRFPDENLETGQPLVRNWKEWVADFHVILMNCIAHGGAE